MTLIAEPGSDALELPAQAAQRLDALLDEWSLIDNADGVLVVRGRISGVDTYAFATDATIQGGALGFSGCRAIAEVTDLAVADGLPIVGVWHSGGARLREGVAGLQGVASVFAAQTRASGRIPQLSVVLGPAAGGAAYGPALTDLVILGPAGRVFVTGPDIVRKVTGEDVDALRLGGPATQGRSGVVHVNAVTDDEAIARTRSCVALLGKQRLPAYMATSSASAASDLATLVPEEHRRSYDIKPVIAAVLDGGTFLEIQAEWARNVVVGLGRLGGRSVGVVANQPQWLAGCLDADTGDKAGRFVQWCNAMGLPLIFLVDVPGYLPGVGQEESGVVRRGAKLLHAYAASTVPRLTVVLRKAFGGAFIAMGSRGLGADAVFAWPGAQVDVMGAVAAVEVLHRRELAAESDPARRADLVLRLVADHEATTGGLVRALECGAVDEIIEPADTRRRLIEALRQTDEVAAADPTPRLSVTKNPPL